MQDARLTGFYWAATSLRKLVGFMEEVWRRDAADRRVRYNPRLCHGVRGFSHG